MGAHRSGDPTGYEVLTLSAAARPPIPAFVVCCRAVPAGNLIVSPERATRTWQTYWPCAPNTAPHKAALLTIGASGGATGRDVHRLAPLAHLADGTLQTVGHAGFPEPFRLAGRRWVWPRANCFRIRMWTCWCCCPMTSSPEHNPELKNRIEAFIGSCWDSWPGDRLQRAHLSDCLAEGQKDVTVQTALLESRLIAGNARLMAVSAPRFSQPSTTGFFCCQNAGDAPAPHQVRKHALLTGAQLQGVPRRPARFAGHFVGGQGRRFTASWDDAGRQWPGHAV
jgi:hypothetical protein